MRALLLDRTHPDAAARFADAGFEVETLDKALTGNELQEALKGVDVLCVRSGTIVSREVIEGANLKAIGRSGVGVDNIDLEAAQEKGVPVFNAPTSNSRSVIELALGLIIMLSRKVFDFSNLMHSGTWHKNSSGAHEIRMRTLGIVGYGNIGAELSMFAESMGMQVIFYDVVPKEPRGSARQVASLEELLQESDAVSVHAGSLPGRKCLLGKEELAHMKEGAILINLGRGSLVCQDALAEALKSGKLAGAAIDVHPDEPKEKEAPYKSPLAGIPNVILTPHIGGSTQEAEQHAGTYVAETILRYLETGDTTGVVTIKK